MDIQMLYQGAIKFAATKHINQFVPGSELPYLLHLSNVAMEVFVAYQSAKNFNIEEAIQIALLHDTIEDTDTSFDEIADLFGESIANGVAALSKNKTIEKNKRMADSLDRIKSQKKEVAIVKLADRITNLQKPPHHWDDAKKENYHGEAIAILQNLKGNNAFLELRLSGKIKEYESYL